MAAHTTNAILNFISDFSQKLVNGDGQLADDTDVPTAVWDCRLRQVDDRQIVGVNIATAFTAAEAAN